MPQPVKAEVGSRRRIVGAIALRAVGRAVITDRHRNFGDHALVGILVIVISRRIVIAGPAIISVGIVGRYRAADHGSGGNCAGPPAAATTAIAAAPATVTAVPGGAAAVPCRAAAGTPSRKRSRLCIGCDVCLRSATGRKSVV